jgi:putative restriction endonuclease
MPENVLCLCPTCHVRFDRYAVAVGEDDALLGLPGTLRRHKKHAVADEYLAYHRDLFLAAQDARAA